MFTHTISPFGTYELHTFAHEATGCQFSVLPDAGALITNLTFGGQSLMDCYETPEQLAAFAWAKNLVLYPYPNRMRDGQYQWEGKTYQFPLNNAVTGNSIHGIGKMSPTRLKNYMLTEHLASVTLVHEYLGDFEYYPFPFLMEITYTMSITNHFEVDLQFKNTGTTTIPAGIGWHPYFKLSDAVNETSLQMPSVEKIEVDERLLPTDVRTSFNDFSSLRRIDETVVDNCFFLLDLESKESHFVLSSELGTLRYWQETGSQKYAYAQVFTPPARNAIAIEPMTCNINAFNNQNGLCALEAGKTLGGRCGFSWESKWNE
jgi:aldose 1-epimerase